MENPDSNFEEESDFCACSTKKRAVTSRCFSESETPPPPHLTPTPPLTLPHPTPDPFPFRNIDLVSVQVNGHKVVASQSCVVYCVAMATEEETCSLLDNAGVVAFRVQ